MCKIQWMQYWLCVLSIAAALLWSNCQAQQQVIEVTESSEAYLLVASTRNIQRMSLNGSNVTTLIQDVGIVAMDFHYRLGLVFWVTNFGSDLKCASLRDGSNVTAMGIRHILRPAGLAVDWINDMVYWVDDYLKAIYVYDMNSKETSLVLQLEDTSEPLKLKVFPQAENSYLYLGERLQGIYRIKVNGGDKMKVRDTDCPYSITLDYARRDLYWLDSCKYQLETSKIDGSNTHLIPTDYDNYFSYGASVYDGHVYWTRTGPTSFVDCLERQSAEQHRVYTVRNTILQDVVIIHPANQPSIAVLELTDVSCDLGCLHGDCVQPGLCSCEPGWTGALCDIDVNECQTDNGGCQDECVNSLGSFHCTCAAGRELSEDLKSCKDKSTTSTPSTTPSSPPTTPSSPPTTPSSPPTTPSSPPTTPSSPPTTTSSPPTTTSSPPTTPSSPQTTTSSPPTTTSTPSNPPTTPQSHTATPSTQASTPSTQTSAPSLPPSTPSPTSQQQPTSSASPSSPTPSATPSSTSESLSTSSRETTTTDVSNLTGENGLESGGAQDKAEVTIILVVVLSAVGIIVIVAIALYLMFLYFKHKHNKTGSYNVQERHVAQPKLRPPQQNTAESGTSSVHSSFRDITAQYHRERVLGGVAELGCTGELRRPSDLSSCGGDLVLNGVNGEGGSTDGSEMSTCGLVTVSIHGSDQLREQN